MNQYTLPTDIINAILQYLAEKPFKESANLIALIKENAKPVEPKTIQGNNNGQDPTNA